MQDVVLDKILAIGNITSAPIEHSDIVFLGYSFEYSEIESSYKMRLSKVIGTTHTQIVNGPLYKKAIDLKEVTQKLQTRI